MAPETPSTVIIPCLDVKDGRVVKGVQFVELKDAGDPVELAEVYDREGADELVFLDIFFISSKRLMPPPTVNGIASLAATLSTTSTIVFLPSWDAEISRKTSSSALI